MQTFKTASDYIESFSDADPDSLLYSIIPKTIAAEASGVTRATLDKWIKNGDITQIKIGKTKYVSLASVLERFLGEVKMQNLALEYIESAARERRTVTYGDLMNHLSLDHKIAPHRTKIAKILGAISRSSVQSYGLMISAIVVLKGYDIPSDGFFELVEILQNAMPDKGELTSYEEEDWERWLEEHQEKIFDYFET